MVVARAELARRRAHELRGPRRRRAPLGGRLPERRPMAARRDGEELVRADKIASVVPAAAGRRAAGNSGLAELRRPRFLNDLATIKAALAQEARAHGFDALGIVRPDAIPDAP